MKNLHLSIICIFSHNYFQQQLFTIKVLNASTGNPLSGAFVKLKSAKVGVTDNIDGT